MSLLQVSPRPAGAGLQWLRANPEHALELAARHDDPPPPGWGYAAAVAWQFLQDHCVAITTNKTDIEPTVARAHVPPDNAQGSEGKVMLWRPLPSISHESDGVVMRALDDDADPFSSTSAMEQQGPSKRARVDLTSRSDHVHPQVQLYLQMVNDGGSVDNLFTTVSTMTETDADAAFAVVLSGGFTDTLLLKVLGDFSTVASELSHSICSCFFRVYLRAWMEQLDAKPPRAVAHAVAGAVTLRLAIAIEQVVLPTVALANFNSFQRAVLSKALTTGLSKSRRSDVVGQLCRPNSGANGNDVHWCDERAALLNDLIQGQTSLSPAVLEELARGLAQSVAARPTSKPLSKLVLSVLQRPREELVQVREYLERACNTSSTVISKSLVAALKRI